LAKTEWGTGLFRFSDEQIAQGIDKAVQSGATMPPTLPKFISYMSGSDLHKTAAYRIYDSKALPKLKTEKQKAAARELVREIKKNLGN